MLKQLSLFLTVGMLASCSAYKIQEPEYATQIADNKVTVKSVDNFRDLGSIVNIDAKSLKDSLIYRSANLSKLKPKNFETLDNLHIAKVIDLHTPDEIGKKPDNLPQGVEYLNLAAFEDKGDQLNQARKQVLRGEVNRNDAENRMLVFYREYVTENPEIIRNIIHNILDANAPVLYHCNAGKDRTGMVTALILKVLKFDDAVIYNDFLSSNNYRKDLVYKRLNLAKKARAIYPKLDVGVLEKLSWVERDYLKAAFDEIVLKYGNIDNYIHTVLQISEPERDVYISKFLE